MRGRDLYVPAWPGLSPGHLLRSRRAGARPFPLGADHAMFFYRARNAIYHLFRALRLAPDETVLMPDYHSGNETSAVRAAGAAVRYYPIRRDLAPDLDALEELCRRHRPRALFAIHYLGWPQPVAELATLCREHEMLLVEDCALSMLSETGGRPLGSFGDYAVFCLYKTLPLPNGGMLVQNRRVLEELTRLPLRRCGIASLGGRTAELLLEWARARTGRLGAGLAALKAAVGRSLTSMGVERVPVGDMGFEIDQVDVAMSSVCRRLLARFDYEAIRERRRANFRVLAQGLAGRVRLLKRELEDGVCPLFFPILVEDKRAVAEALWRRGIAAVQFWNEGDPEADEAGASDARFLRRHVLELPIHQDVTPAQLHYMVEQVSNLEPLVSGAVPAHAQC
jgi:dTDP-4-amino-4,6-dideoxygalactose transaminase